MANARFLAGMLLLGLACGCKAQTPPPSAPDPGLDRRIEILVRSDFDLPADDTVIIGARKPSSFTGYETLPIIITRRGTVQQFDFLISNDNTKLVHMDSMDLTKDPANAIPIEGRPMRGNPNAKVTIVNFDDLECPYCGRMHQQLFPATSDRYKDLVRFVYKDFPLTEIHPWAMHAAVDANCLAAQSSSVYWDYVDYLHSHGQEVNGEDGNPAKSTAALDRIARQEATVGKLDSAALDACIAKQDQTQIKASMQLAESMGIQGTPAIFINGEKIDGAVPTEQLWIVIDRALRSVGENPPSSPAAKPAPAATGQGASH
ncbi:MAG: thioredoxin domain-containing protein [Terracidiphilus sp.]